MYATFRYNFQSIRRREELKNRGLFLEGWKRRRRRGGGKGEAGGWLQKNGVELSISPEETSSHFSIVPFPSRVRQGLKSACYSVPPPPPTLPSNIKRMFRYLGVDRSSGLFKFFIQNFGKPSEEGKRRGGVEGGDVIPYPSRRQTRSSKAVIITIAIIAIISRREEGNDWHATLVRGSQKRNGNVTSCAIKLTVSPTAANPGNVYIRMDPSGADYMQFAHRRHNVKIA